MHIVYALIDPRTGKRRYVGTTSKPLHERVAIHMSGLFSRPVATPSVVWLRELSLRGLAPKAVQLQRVNGDRHDAFKREKAWIRRLRAQGVALTNVYPPTDHRPWTDEQRAEHSVRMLAVKAFWRKVRARQRKVA